jgi:hypothetical protein
VVSGICTILAVRFPDRILGFLNDRRIVLREPQIVPETSRMSLRRSKRKDRIFLGTVKHSGLEAILGAYMHPVFLFIVQLLRLFLIRADEQLVMKDAEAIGYVGQICRGVRFGCLLHDQSIR